MQSLSQHAGGMMHAALHTPHWREELPACMRFASTTIAVTMPRLRPTEDKADVPPT